MRLRRQALYPRTSQTDHLPISIAGSEVFSNLLRVLYEYLLDTYGVSDAQCQPVSRPTNNNPKDQSVRIHLLPLSASPGPFSSLSTFPCKMSLIEQFRRGNYPHLKAKYPAKEHAKRVANYIQATGTHTNGVIYLESQKTRLIEDNDTAQRFRYVSALAPMVSRRV